MQRNNEFKIKMEEERLYILSIAGFDPSGGAGILADIKTFEANKVYGLGVCSCLTFQNDTNFEGVKWISSEDIIKQIDVLVKRFSFEWVKIGLIENLKVLQEIVNHLKKINSKTKIIWDPILKASSGFVFHNIINNKELIDVCKNLYLITPNLEEIKKLLPDETEEAGAENLSQYCNVLLKGGHGESNLAKDILFENKAKTVLEAEKIEKDKHGTGCVLSSAILTNLAKGYDLKDACKEGKDYTIDFINSHNSLLGFHYV
jgi:hydroxymethylpyrimidine/phosphomethylpyrimidine kinase